MRSCAATAPDAIGPLYFSRDLDRHPSGWGVDGGPRIKLTEWHHGPRLMHHGPRLMHYGPCLMRHGPCLMHHGLRLMSRGRASRGPI